MCKPSGGRCGAQAGGGGGRCHSHRDFHDPLEVGTQPSCCRNKSLQSLLVYADREYNTRLRGKLRCFHKVYYSHGLPTIMGITHFVKNLAWAFALWVFLFSRFTFSAPFRPFTTNVRPNHPILGWSRLSGRGLTRAVSNCVSNFPAKVTIPVSDHHHFVLLSFAQRSVHPAFAA
jgi:hypothetical protein